jgi:formylglycine-generating enzyme required for sulfatase activity
MYDPLAEANESPPHEVELDPYFLSKFEMTQDQWMRFTAQNPSAYGPGTAPGNVVTTSLHPVEQVSWKKAIVVLERLGLVLPTEAQWERGARAGTETPWWTGSERESIGGAANLGDRFAGANGAPAWWVYESWLDDGHTTHAPVGSYRANPFGLHDVIGNAFESCRDGYGTYALSESPGDGARVGTDPRSHIIRGGGYHTSAKRSRSSFRTDVAPDYSDYAMGLRPAMSLTP